MQRRVTPSALLVTLFLVLLADQGSCLSPNAPRRSAVAKGKFVHQHCLDSPGAVASLDG